MAAFLLVDLVARLLDLSRYESVKIIHAVLLLWNEAASLVGTFIGLLPFVPKISAELVNVILFSVTLFGPIYVGAIYALFNWHFTAENEDGDEYRVHGFFPKLVWVFEYISSIIIVVFMSLSGTVAYAMIITQDDPMGYILDYVPVVPWLVMSGVGVLMFAAVVKMVPSYGRGVLTVALFFTALEGLYFTPILSEPIANWADSVIENHSCKLKKQPSNLR